MAHCDVRIVLYKAFMPEQKAKSWREIAGELVQETDLQKAHTLSRGLNEDLRRANPPSQVSKPQSRAS